MISETTRITKVGFGPRESFSIKAKSLSEAFFLVGQKTSDISREKLKSIVGGSNKKKGHLAKAREDLRVIELIAKSSKLEVLGVNYASRYLEALKGFARGAGLTLPEIALLQKEVEAGCQTLIARNSKGDFSFLHTEEEGEDDQLLSGKFNYRLVSLRLPDKKITFFAYPGTCLWGPAFAMDQTNNLVQFVDDINIADKYQGSLWANFVAFVFFDGGNIIVAKQIASKFNTLAQQYGFANGYAVHLLQGGKKPQIISFEFGEKIIKKLSPFKDYFYQVNLPKSKDILKVSTLNVPSAGKRWAISYQMLHLEMTRREKRLNLLLKKNWWKVGTASSAIKSGLKVLAYPYGDLRSFKDTQGERVYYHTGLPSRWTAAHFLGYVGKKSELYIGKLTPKPIKGMEYNNNINANYKYKEEVLWDLRKRLKK